MSAAYAGRFVVPVVDLGQDHADVEAEEPVDLAHPLGVALGQVVVDRDEVDAVARRARSGTRASVATSVLPSPVFISATQPKCSAAPPMIWTSKWRWPSVRAAGLAHRGERLGEQVVEGLDRASLGVGADRVETGAELAGQRAQLVVGAPLHLGLERGDLGNDRLERA